MLPQSPYSFNEGILSKINEFKYFQINYFEYIVAMINNQKICWINYKSEEKNKCSKNVCF